MKVKKASLLIGVLGLVLINGLAFGSLTNPNPKYLSATAKTTGGTTGYIADPDFIQFEFKNHTIPTGNSNFIQVKFERVLDWDALYIPAVTSGGDAVTTANVDFLLQDDTIIANGTITVGTVFTTQIASHRLQIKMYNPSANVETVVTTSIQAWND